MSNAQSTIDPKKLTTKQSAMHELLRTHYSIYVHLDSRRDGVIVPPQLKKPRLLLQFGLNMKPPPMADFKMDDKGFSATMSFNRTPFTVFVPWSSVFAIVGDSGIGNVWTKDVPADVDTGLKQTASFDGTKEVVVHRDPSKHKTLPPGWAIIDGGKK